MVRHQFVHTENTNSDIQLSQTLFRSWKTLQ